MLVLLLNRLGIDASEYLIKNTNKAREPFLEDDYRLLRVGCAVDKWSSEFPELVIKNKEIKKIKRFKSKSIISAYKKALLKDADYNDLRKCRFNYYEECALKELFGEEIKKEILGVYRVTFDYLESKGIQTDRDKLKFEVRPLATDLCTGRKTYTIMATLPDKKKGGKWIYPLKQRKMPLDLWEKVKPYMEYYRGRSDNFDPMGEVERGTYYTFSPEKVEEIIKKWEDN